MQEYLKPGNKMAGCICNQMKDYSERTNGKENDFGITASYRYMNAKVSKWSFCDPLKPEDCPMDLPVCVKSTIIDADFANKRYQNYAMLYMGMMHPGVSSYFCMGPNEVKEGIIWQSSSQKQDEMYAFMGWKYKMAIIKPSKRASAMKMREMKKMMKDWNVTVLGGDDSDDDDDDMKMKKKKMMKMMKEGKGMMKEMMKRGKKGKKSDDRMIIFKGNAVGLAATAATALSMINFL